MMKKILLFTLIALTVISCKKETTIDYAIISGTVTNASSDKITIYDRYTFGEKQEINLQEDGSFNDTIHITQSGFYSLVEKRNSVNLFLSKGDNLKINFNAKKLDSTLSIAGKGNQITNYLSKKNNLTKELRGSTKDLYSKNEKDFLESVAKLKTAQQDLLFNQDLIEGFKKNETKNIDYQYLSLLNNYEGYHSYFTKNKDFKASKGFLDGLNNFDYLNEKDFIFSNNYRNLVGAHYRKESKKLVEKDSLLEEDIAHLKTLALIESKTIKNKLLHENATYGITYTEKLEDFYKIFSEASTDTKNNEKIAKIYNKLKVLSKGNVSPKFTDYENNAGGTTSLDDFKGKYVYIDVWATWCGPCIKEIPSLKKLEKQYHGKNIEFLSISIDDKKDHDKWKKMIVDKELKGVQVYADNNWESKFVQDYQIKGIPRFILIDPQGNIVTANAPRPSDDKLVALFNEYKI